MDVLYVLFPISGVKTWVFLPPLVALLVSSFTSMAGVSGAFILLPFQMSILGFTSPAVSSTNIVYNIVVIPSGIYRYFKEGRMAWPLTWVMIVGTLPGVFFGYYLRILYLPNPRTFKFFVGLVLFYIGGRLLYEVSGKAQAKKANMNVLDQKFAERASLIKEKRHSQRRQDSRRKQWSKPLRLISGPLNMSFGANGSGSAFLRCFCLPSWSESAAEHTA